MKYPRPNQHKQPEAFRAHLQGIAPDLDVDDTLLAGDGPLGKGAVVAGRQAANRFAVQPMEGWDGSVEGTPSQNTLRRWRNFGLSGAGLLWGGEAFAVDPEGRANPQQLCHFSDETTARTLEDLRKALLAGREEAGLCADGLVSGLQLTHSGRWSRPDLGGPKPRIPWRHPLLDGRVGIEDDAAILSDGELEGIGENFVAVAVLARDAGFDFVDVKCCHGYLLHELLASHRRSGPYGGDLAGRSRLVLSIIDAIASEAPGLAVGVRLSLHDLLPHRRGEDGSGQVEKPAGEGPYLHAFGLDSEDPERLDLSEPFAFVSALREHGVDLINVTLGSPYYCPHIQRPASFPPSDGYQPPEDPLAGVAAHLRGTRRLKAEFPDLTVVGSGYSYLQEWLPHVGQHEVGQGHVDFVGLGRSMLSYPELPRDVLAGEVLARKKVCRTFSDCTTGPRNGFESGCYPLDPYYKKMPAASSIKGLRPPRKGER